MTPNPAPASTLACPSRAGEEGAVPLLIPASSDSCWDPQPPPARREVPGSQVETVLGAPQSCLLCVSSHLCLPVLPKQVAPRPWPGAMGPGQSPVCLLGAGDHFLRSHLEAAQAWF